MKEGGQDNGRKGRGVAQANEEVDASDGVGGQGELRGRRGSLGSPICYRCRRRTQIRTARARLTWRKQARRHMRMWPIRDRLSVVERLVGIESVTKAGSLGREDSGTGTLSFSGISGGGFPGEGTALTFAVSPDEPDADKSLASCAEVYSPPVVVVVWLSDRTVGRLGPGEPQHYASLGTCALATRSATASRGWV